MGKVFYQRSPPGGSALLSWMENQPHCRTKHAAGCLLTYSCGGKTMGDWENCNRTGIGTGEKRETRCPGLSPFLFFWHLSWRCGWESAGVFLVFMCMRGVSDYKCLEFGWYYFVTMSWVLSSVSFFPFASRCIDRSASQAQWCFVHCFHRIYTTRSSNTSWLL